MILHAFLTLAESLYCTNIKMNTGYYPRHSIFAIDGAPKNTFTPIFRCFLLIITTDKFCTSVVVTVLVLTFRHPGLYLDGCYLH
jgi:hypothetical protein